MLFHVEMTVHLPHMLEKDIITELQRSEREMARALQQRGVWRHLWRLVGRYANISIFDVKSASELHEILSNLPLFPYMDIVVRPLCRHPSSIADDEGGA